MISNSVLANLPTLYGGEVSRVRSYIKAIKVTSKVSKTKESGGTHLTLECINGENNH